MINALTLIRRSSYTIVAILAGVLSACSTMPETAISSSAKANFASSSLDPSVMQYISPALSASEQSIMYPIMAMLAPPERQNVFYYDNDGKLHVNRPEIVPIDLASPSPSTSHKVRSLATLAPCVPSTSNGGCTGFYVQHLHSLQATDLGYGYIRSLISVPCASTVLNEANQLNSGNAYVTLYPPQISPSSAPLSVEFGLQFNGTDNSQQPTTSVQPYVSDGGQSPSRLAFQQVARLQCDQSPSVIFSAHIAQQNLVSARYAVIGIAGAFSNLSDPCPGGAPKCSINLTTVNPIAQKDGVDQVCLRCTISWTSSLAVDARAPQFVTGSRFGVDTNCVPQLSWTSVAVGRYQSSGPNAQPSTTPWTNTSVVTQPSNAADLGVLRLSDNGDANETIGFDESQQACPLNANIY